MDSSSVTRKTSKSTKPSNAEDTTPVCTIGNPLQLKQTNPSRTGGMETRSKKGLKSTTNTRKSSAYSDNSHYLESDDSGDSGRLQIAWDADNNETQSNHSEGSESNGASSCNNDTRTWMHLESSLGRCPLKRWSAVVTFQNAKIPLVYHKSMVRQYPSKDRTPQQMEMRRRNTEAARLSKAKKRMAELMMEKEASELSTANTSIKHIIATQLVYTNKLRRLMEMSSVELNYFKRVGHRNNEVA